MTTVTSLTHPEAETRARLLTVSRYDIEIDLTGLLEGEVWESTSTVTFSCGEPGASTFVDAVGEVSRATLNGVDLDVATADGGRLPLTGLAADNTLVVELSQANTAASAGILRTVDPTDGLVYVWTSLECDDARRLWGCFDQPDLKALHRFTVTAPEAWTVTSNMRPEAVTDPEAGARTWSFPDTPPLSPYVTVVNAGPFHEIREQRGTHSLGLYCRQSLVPNLERDAPSLLDLTEAGLVFFGDRFGQPFPEAHYDQVFVPNMGGAMENWGCVTWGDGYLHRGTPTHSQRSMVAITLLHEMAHMWFGDLVHALVGRPVAQRGVRVVGLDLGRRRGHRVRRRVGRVPGGSQAGRLPGRHGAGHPRHPQRGPRRRDRPRQLRLHHLRQGPGGPAPADGLRR